MIFFFLILAGLMALPLLLPGVDLAVSGAFYAPGAGFALAQHPAFLFVHDLANGGARVLGAGFLVAAVLAFLLARRGEVVGLAAKAWAFLFLALLIAPGLVANVLLKDNWGRYRPREIVEFGGDRVFTPALIPHFEQAHSNGSFVSGDGAFGFFLVAFAFVVPVVWARRAFWVGMAAGCGFAFVRIAMGAHFFSDNVYAAGFMLLAVSAVHAALYGAAATKARWLAFFGRGGGAF